jgi:hypothetical protein
VDAAGEQVDNQVRRVGPHREARVAMEESGARTRKGRFQRGLAGLKGAFRKKGRAAEEAGDPGAHAAEVARQAARAREHSAAHGEREQEAFMARQRARQLAQLASQHEAEGPGSPFGVRGYVDPDLERTSSEHSEDRDPGSSGGRGPRGGRGRGRGLAAARGRGGRGGWHYQPDPALGD